MLEDNPSDLPCGGLRALYPQIPLEEWWVERHYPIPAKYLTGTMPKFVYSRSELLAAEMAKLSLNKTVQTAH